MPASLDPIDKDETAFRVRLNGKRIGTVRRNITMGETIWQLSTSEDGPFTGVFSQKEHAAEQLAVNHVTRKGKKK